MLIIKNVFKRQGKVIVNCSHSTYTRSINEGDSYTPQTGITQPLTLQAVDQDQGPEHSSFKISPLPTGLKINLSYDAVNKTWTMKRGVRSLIECKTPVNVEIGP